MTNETQTGVGQEMTLEEVIEILPEGHRAKREYKELFQSGYQYALKKAAKQARDTAEIFDNAGNLRASAAFRTFANLVETAPIPSTQVKEKEDGE